MYLIVIIFTSIQFLCAIFGNTVVTIGLISIMCCVIDVCTQFPSWLEYCRDHFNRQF